MIPPSDQEKIADLRGLIARAEERVRKIQTRSEPGTSRMVHALTNRIRTHRREILKRLARQADATTQGSQLLQQQRQIQQIQRDAPADHSSELPAKQDQEPRGPAAQQGAVADQ